MKNKSVVIIILSLFVVLAILKAWFFDGRIGKVDEVLRDLASKAMILSGTIVDEKGNPVNDVYLIIEKGKTDISELFMTEREYTDKKVRSKNTEIEKMIINSTYSFEYKGWHSIEFTFSKKGYYPVRETLTTMSSGTREGEEALGQRIKEGIRIVLRETGPLAKLKWDGICLDLEKDEDGKIIKTGWVYLKKRDLKNGTDEKRNNIVYDDPSEVDFYVEKTEDGNGLYLIANGDAGFIRVENIPDLTYLSEAPEGGYQNKITIPFRNNNQYCYFKLKEGLYGKLRISTASENEDKTMYGLTGTYYLNTTGSRNLRSMDKY